jgi:YesN/AraC family two-component response regulator
VSITVVLAEDDALLRHGLSRLIDSAADLNLVGAAADLPRCLSLVEEHGPV